MDTAAFGPVTQIEVGALLVGETLKPRCRSDGCIAVPRRECFSTGARPLFCCCVRAPRICPMRCLRKPRVARKRPSAWAKYSVTRIKNKKLEGKTCFIRFSPPVSPWRYRLTLPRIRPDSWSASDWHPGTSHPDRTVRASPALHPPASDRHSRHRHRRDGAPQSCTARAVR